MIVKCDKCGKEFEKSDKRAKESLKMGWKMFCSDECRKSYKTKKVVCECVNCGKTFERILSQIREQHFVQNHVQILTITQKELAKRIRITLMGLTKAEII